MQKITHLPYRIGITGTIGSGKSLIGTILKDLNIPVLDTDIVVDDLYRQDAQLKKELVETFGPDVLDSYGSVDKSAVSRKVFGNPAALKQLEALVHPRVADWVNAFLADPTDPSPFRAVLVPLLFEADTQDRYDEIWAVTVYPEDELLRRIVKRGPLSLEDAKKRMTRQWSQEEKARHAKVIIDNSKTPEDTRCAVVQLIEALKERIS